MDSKKKKIIENLKEQLTQIPKDEILPFFLAANERLKQENITFSKDELKEFMNVFEEQADPQEMKQIRLLKELLGE